MTSTVDIDNEFPLESNLLYLNHAAVSPWPKRTSQAVKRFAEENTVSGAANYPDWLKKENELRHQLKDLINAGSIQSIALLKNTSEALSVVAEGIRWKSGENIVTSAQEFPSNRIPWLAQARHGVELREVDLNSGESPEAALMLACDRNTRLLTISSVQYGTGLKINLEQLGQFCRKKGILFCVDAIQSLGAHEFDVQACIADFVMADAHKWMLGPEGISLFYCDENRLDQLELHQFGWHMVEHAGNYDLKEWSPASDARRFECGSPNMLGIHAFSASLSLLLDYGITNVERDIDARTRIIDDAFRSTAGYRMISPEQADRRAGIVNFQPLDTNVVALHKQLMKRNLICAQRGGGIRLSPHFYTDRDAINRAIELIKSLD